MEKSKLKSYCFVSAFTVILYLVLSNLDRVPRIGDTAIRLLTPFIIGIVLAFVLNSVMVKFEHGIFRRVGLHKNPRIQKLMRPLSLLSTYLLLIAVVSILVTVVAPQLADSVLQLKDDIPAYLNSLQVLAIRISNEIKLPPEIWVEINTWFQAVAKSLLSFVVNVVPQLLNMVVSFGGGLFNAFIGIIVSIYILSSKEQLLSQAARLNRAFMPHNAGNRIASAASVAAGTFSNYVTGQLLDALIVGIVSVIGLSLFGFEYALLIGLIMGCTNIIPFFGPFIGAVPGFFITLMIDPVRSLWYILFVLVVQQVDGNILAPKIIGDSVGLPPLWVLFGVTVGGGLFGLAGMVLGTPVFAVIYILLGRATRAKEEALMEKPIQP